MKQKHTKKWIIKINGGQGVKNQLSSAMFSDDFSYVQLFSDDYRVGLGELGNKWRRESNTRPTQASVDKERLHNATSPS